MMQSALRSRDKREFAARICTNLQTLTNERPSNYHKPATQKVRIASHRIASPSRTLVLCTSTAQEAGEPRVREVKVTAIALVSLIPCCALSLPLQAVAVHTTALPAHLRSAGNGEFSACDKFTDFAINILIFQTRGQIYGNFSSDVSAVYSMDNVAFQSDPCSRQLSFTAA